MADVKIADLLAATTVNDNDLFIVEDNADTKKITKANLINFLGSIVESASNANGSYVKFADGTMICTIQRTINVQISTALPSGGFRSNGFNFTLPANFHSTPLVFGGVSGLDAFTAKAYPSQANPTSVCIFFVQSINQVSTPIDFAIYVFLIGRWKA